ncbi:MAG: nitrate ABC transporter, permease protein [Pseudomonadales bacterium RIFCSPHIGHO2_12_FULL_40_16]|jgi:nitrate/nitrite transport system permease protein|uniref:Nitrate ABC transporter, permease n=2 Tax=Acinetobacter TaxID=469 RepID=N9C5K4_9GAMM|nr:MULTISPECIES: nitrate ABC transporter permease [Acinetobacter]OHC21582.1 MAG: nitrate ABC transporter, permease protein [Pseudomonadales bacterium RIFCSPHIGHO2_12_FULL_40_16]ENU87769.1 nitrate ABC transporter, permease [Acinetobacter sp. CIP 102529]ENV80796.1 nitrate ABC transporter, permease [Acinetobacter ursingii ANC 3649]MCF7643405.1 nitrate ABC transporter permease [Acinetobacter johnsonii]MCU4394540.1 nitrate ABC transporter permease [Acinetobacter parvus]
MSLKLKSAVLSCFLMLSLLMVWQIATMPKPKTGMTSEQTEYAKLMGKIPDEYGNVKANNGMPTPNQFVDITINQLKDPFYDNGPNDKGIGIQLMHSLGRVAIGFLLAVMVAIPVGFLIGNSPLLYKVLDPFIQILKPISPLAWMPIALYTIKDSTTSAIFVIFICSLWPMLINTAFGVAAVRKDWLNVARVLEVNPLRKAFLVVLPAAAPTIITGMRISMGIAWLVIVAAEMLVGGTGIGYFVWNQWNNLSIGNVVFAVFLIGLIGMLLDMMFGQLQKKVTYVE